MACTDAGAVGADQLSCCTAVSFHCSAAFGNHGGMCGRFAVTTDPALLAEKIKALGKGQQKRPGRRAQLNNVAPTTTINTVVRRHTRKTDDELTRRVRSMRWGLVPPWIQRPTRTARR